jgi:hypothetical protein
MKEIPFATDILFIAEIGYLRVTIAPNIRQIRGIKVDGKYKNATLSLQEPRQSIKNAV